MLFTNQQISDILENVDFYHTLFTIENVGLDILTKKDKTLLISRGVDLSKYKDKIGYIEYSFNFGRLEASVRDNNKLKKLTLKEYKKFIDQNPDQFKFSIEDKRNIKIAKQQIYSDIKRANDAIKSDLHQSLIEVSKTYPDKQGNKKKILNTITNKLKESEEKYNKRFELISSYNAHSSYQQGISSELIKQKGENVRVWFQVHPQACKYCKITYLRKNGQPKVFYLKNVIGNGSNIGRIAKQYKPSVEPLHPRCRCKLNLYPAGKNRWSVKQNKYIRNFS